MSKKDFKNGKLMKSKKQNGINLFFNYRFDDEQEVL